ncbi:MAG: hypothetical protein ACKV2Q_19055 [Planctomycetaceae bacterium]
MKFTVVWTPNAEQRLAELWMGHPQLQREMTAAANEIDARLRHNPVGQGESRVGSLRIMFVPPFVVDFEVVLDDQRIEVLNVALPKQHLG